MAGVFRNADLRVSLLLVLANAVAVMICTSEACFIALLLLACLWLCLRGTAIKALKIASVYLVLSGLSYITLGVRGCETIWLFSGLLRRLLIPVSYTTGLAEASTGTLLAVFQRLNLPNSFGISTVVLLRFLPTIVYELREIRSSLKFRNIGDGFGSTVSHLPANFERTIVPLLIRTTRIAEELSAAAMVRGVRLRGRIISFDEVSFRRGDAVIASAFCLAAALVCAADRLSLFRIFV